MKNVDNAAGVRSRTSSETITIGAKDLPRNTVHNCCNS